MSSQVAAVRRDDQQFRRAISQELPEAWSKSVVVHGAFDARWWLRYWPEVDQLARAGPILIAAS